ncbi:MAG: hypothetical protein ABJR05_07990 [Balneola sp.]
MNRDRLIAITLFSSSAALVWILFVTFLIDGGFFSLLNLTGVCSSIIAASVVSSLIAPRIYKIEQSKRTKQFGALHGVGITFLSFFLGSILFFGSGFMVDGYSLNFKIIQEQISLALTGFLVATIFMSPGYLLGAFTGVIYVNYLNRK